MERPVELVMMYLREELTPETEQELVNWIKESEENEALFKEFTDPAIIKSTLKELLAIDHERGWQQLLEKMKRRNIFGYEGLIKKP